MASAVMDDMAKQTSEFRTYISMKLDRDVIPLAGAASKLAGQALQDWASDVLNEAASKVLGRKPIKRKPPKPRS